MKLSLAQLRSDITGPSLFYAPSYLFVLPVFLLTSLLSTAHLGDWKSLLLWSLANVLSMALCWGLIAIADRLVFSRRNEAWLWNVLLFSAFIGATKGGTTTLLGTFLGVEENFAALIGGRMVQTALLGLVTIPALAILAATRSRFQNERDALVAEKVRVAATDNPVNATTRKEYLRLAEEIGKVRSQLQDTGAVEVSALIRDIVQTGLRPITHRLWADEDKKQTNFSLRDLSRVAIVSHPFVAWPVALILFLGTLGPYIAASGWSQGFTRSVLTAVSIGAVYGAFRLIKTKSVPMAWLVYVFAHLVLAVLIVLLSKALFGDLSGFTDVSAFFVLYIWILQTGYMTSFVVGAMATHFQMREQLEALSKNLGLDRRVIQARALLAKRDIANYLHSELQNNLLAIALKVEAGDANMWAVSEELGEIQKLLNSGASPETTDDRSLHIQLSELAERWAGFVQVSVYCAFDMKGKAMKRQVVLVVSEGISNAIRHGLASSVSVRIAKTKAGISVELFDDGIGPKTGQAGLGSKFFESVSGSNWSIDPRPEGGSILRVVI